MKNFLIKIYRSLRIFKYSFLSNNRNKEGNYTAHQPVLSNGLGRLVFGSNVNFGVINSPKFYSSYAYIEARTQNATITFGDNVHINNACSIISEKQITIANNVLIGYNCQIADSDFHDLNKNNRLQTDPFPQEVIVSENVFIGNNVTILKGVVIGANTVVANGSIVTKSFPENVIIGGVPAKILKDL
ncbi:acyltransferase [Aequorivita lipolytica]|uniref:acyltransferase n=1 Tax=Aequorivita lipolytica TaxID=153267 RepID=UPI000DBC36FF|nr:acyltransferase [Aequorivita lipolytica]SRX52962.1 Galactoside O-acetyltransferase [Aequorivita lipolytica]